MAGGEPIHPETRSSRPLIFRASGRPSRPAWPGTRNGGSNVTVTVNNRQPDVDRPKCPQLKATKERDEYSVQARRELQRRYLDYRYDMDDYRERGEHNAHVQTKDVIECLSKRQRKEIATEHLQRGHGVRTSDVGKRHAWRAESIKDFTRDWLLPPLFRMY